MSGKNTKNPLLSGAGISFPFENFTNSALLVPVSQNEASLIPDEIEADSFLGQEPASGPASFKPFASSASAFSKSFSSHTLSSHTEPALTPDLRTHFPSEPHLPQPTPSPIPVFTQSFTGFSSPTKPTPVYADALNQQFTQNLNLQPHLISNSEIPLQSSQVTPPNQAFQAPPPSSLFFTNQVPTNYISPTIFTPSLTPITSNSSPSVHSTHNNTPDPPPPSQTVFNYFSSLGSEQSSVPLNSVPLNSVPLNSVPLNSVPLNSIPQNSISQSSASQNSILQNSVPLKSVPPSPPHLSAVLTAPTPTPPLTLPPQRPPETNAPPPAGGPANSYRLSNIKRPVYSRPPELGVAPTSAPPAPVEAPLAPAMPPPMAPALFTPCAVDSLGTEPAQPVPQPTLTYKFPSQTPPPTVLPPSFANLAQGASYRPVYHHWFYKKLLEGKVLWQPFSMSDSLALEQAFTSATISPDTKVATDGGRYDVEVLRRRRTAVYWEEESGEVRRCSWFVKGSMDIRYVPYEENVATMLEEEYRIASTNNEWNRHVPLPDGEMIVIHSPNAIAHHTRSASPDVWGNSPQMQQKPRVVKRGMDEFDISDGEPEKVDHLLFLVHGIGKFCDLKFRPVTEVVDDFRSVSLQLLQSHFKDAVESGQVGRVEVLPVSWHAALHNEHIDTRLNNITLRSIPRLRHFTNDTLLDILFYTSPVFCETIVQAVGNELNRLHSLFVSRNPGFDGGVSLGGHSLGSLILFDMLCHQLPAPSPSPTGANASPTTLTPAADSQEVSGEEEMRTLGCMRTQRARLSRSISYVTIGTAGTGQPFISYPQLSFRPRAFFALGSPIGMFVTVRGIESLGEDFALPTCPLFFNIFHPFDPVAYRVESLINSDFSKYSPVLIPHHKGRKRMHLELKDTLEHVGTALKQKLLESVKNTWNTVYQLAMFHRTDDQSIQQEVNKVIENEIMQSCPNEISRSGSPEEGPGPDVKMGQLNGGRRVDYVLQEAPLESFNEYLFALSSHVCYWESEDTMLMMLKEIYSTMDIRPDTQVVQQILPFDMPDGVEGDPHYLPLTPATGPSVGMDPTAPISDNIHIPPPPKIGFVRK